MKRKRLLWQLFPTYILLTLCALLAATWYDAASLRRFFLHHTSQDLHTQAYLMRALFVERLAARDSTGIDSLCKSLGRSSGTRFTVVLPEGRVIGDSLQAPAEMENHADRIEITQALQGIVGQSSRYSHTLHKEMMYVAVPLIQGNRRLGVLRTSLPLIQIKSPLQQIDVQLFLAGLVIAGLAAVISLLVSRHISRPLEELRRGAVRFASGDLREKLPVPDYGEVGSLAEAMNDMARQLNERIEVILRHQNELATILSSMVEGVLAVDREAKIISANDAAAVMLQFDLHAALGRPIYEMVRNAGLQQLVQQILVESRSIENEIVLADGSNRSLQATGALLHDAREGVTGVVIVLNDVTRLRKLERVRSDFVANVSHELRTPLTSIKGFVEALLDGALDDREEAEHFLQVIASQVERLEAIIEDLLLLSTVEHGSERMAIGFEEGPLSEVLYTAKTICDLKAKTRGITLTVNCPNELILRINYPLLEQAVVNLIDNAIKYSESGKSVHIEATCRSNEAVIAVTDAGSGIPAEHLPHLFERFYRVDKARSRKLGGTGLGLAIVKHIATAHGGYVTVDSTPGAGSSFQIHLPVKPAGSLSPP